MKSKLEAVELCGAQGAAGLHGGQKLRDGQVASGAAQLGATEGTEH